MRHSSASLNPSSYMNRVYIDQACIIDHHQSMGHRHHYHSLRIPNERPSTIATITSTNNHHFPPPHHHPHHHYHHPHHSHHYHHPTTVLPIKVPCLATYKSARALPNSSPNPTVLTPPLRYTGSSSIPSLGSTMLLLSICCCCSR